LALQELFYRFRSPSTVETSQEWVEWAFALKAQADHRYGLEFVEGWDSTKIAAVGMAPLIGTLVMAITWAELGGGNLQTVFAVASYALAVCTGAFLLPATDIERNWQLTSAGIQAALLWLRLSVRSATDLGSSRQRHI